MTNFIDNLLETLFSDHHYKLKWLLGIGLILLLCFGTWFRAWINEGPSVRTCIDQPVRCHGLLLSMDGEVLHLLDKQHLEWRVAGRTVRMVNRVRAVQVGEKIRVLVRFDRSAPMEAQRLEILNQLYTVKYSISVLAMLWAFLIFFRTFLYDPHKRRLIIRSQG